MKQITPLRLQALGALMRENNDEKIREWLLMHWEIDFSSLAPELQARAIEKVFSLLEPEDRHHYILHFYQCDPMPPYSATNYSQYSTEAKQKIIEYLFQIDDEFRLPFIQFLISGYRQRPEFKMLIETNPMVVDSGSGTDLPILLAMAREPTLISYIAEVYLIKSGDESLLTEVMKVHNQESFLAYICYSDISRIMDMLKMCLRKKEFTEHDTINSGVNIGGEVVFSIAPAVIREIYMFRFRCDFNRILTMNKVTLNQSRPEAEFGMYEGGISPLYWLAIYRPAHELLSINKGLRTKITSVGLNQPVTGDGPHQGMSPLFFLARKPKGRLLLRKKADLRTKITREGLNRPVAADEGWQGMSPLYSLAECPDDGRELLRNKALRAMITEKGLNQPVTGDGDGDDKGKSPLYWLARGRDGSELLLSDDDLRTKITSVGLNQPVTGDGPDKGKSPLYWLVGFPDGRELLRNNADLRALITPEGLNQPVTGDGDDKGKSPLYWLAICSAGRELLRNNADLRALITPAGLNQAVTGDGREKGMSPLYWLAICSAGRELLRNNADLRALITPAGLNQAVTGDGREKGMSPLYCLTMNPEGIQILKKIPNLMNMITDEALNTKVDSSEKSPADYLEQTDEGRKLLDKIKSAKRCASGLFQNKGKSSDSSKRESKNKKTASESEQMEMSEMNANDKRCMPPT